MGAAGRVPQVLLLALRRASLEPPPTDPSIVGVRMGAFDEDPGVRPSYRQYVAYAAAWEPIPDDGLPRYPERRPPDA